MMTATVLEERLRHELARAIDANLYTVHSFACKAGIAPATVARFVQGRTTTRITTLDRILSGLDLTLEDLIPSRVGL